MSVRSDDWMIWVGSCFLDALKALDLAIIYPWRRGTSTVGDVYEYMRERDPIDTVVGYFVLLLHGSGFP